jgi:hypothetical protein
MGLRNNPICRKCGTEEETSVHVLCECEWGCGFTQTYISGFLLFWPWRYQETKYRGADKSIAQSNWKTIERSPFFIWRGGHCSHGDLVGRTTFWIFFEWLAKVRVWSLQLVSFLVRLRTYQHPGTRLHSHIPQTANFTVTATKSPCLKHGVSLGTKNSSLEITQCW